MYSCAPERAIRQGEPVPLRKEPTTVQIDRTSDRYASFDDWCREVVWWGNKKGAYLYNSRPGEAQLAGHF